ncbi:MULTISPECIES: cupin domain-containing protein [Sporosarcina]|uniref:cupin domain-containing protein n=1 Tax=Sporosarcina TaxID=1569 RepID=UPI00129A8A17|nr:MULTISPECIES: cupin domain-containing protein [Sporosarcina]GKV67412.1 cupin [Sporosarcina sp. NCCP-2331]GLB57768.1 cupin [Sporosarcina sp. NCCP-2378]
MSQENQTGNLRYIHPEDVETQMFDWGTLKWFSEPRVTNAQKFSMGIVNLKPGKGHDRHNHPEEEEVLYVVSGEGEQTVDDGAPTKITAGMCVHIPAGSYHSTINTGWETLKLVAIYSPHGPETVLRADPACTVLKPGELPEF